MLLFPLLLLSAAPSAAEATKLAAAKKWEDLYLGFAAAAPDGTPKGDRSKVAQALLKGCTALQGEDPVMAFSLGEKSVAFNQTAEALLCTALTAARSEQRSAAEDNLRQGYSAFPKDGRFSLELGRFYLEDGQLEEGVKYLKQVPPKSKEGLEAKKLLATSAPAPGKDSGGKGSTAVANVDPTAPRARPSTITTTGSLSYETSTNADGYRVRQNRYFSIRFFNQKRDFGEVAEYEGKVQAALEEARTTVERLLGVARERPCDVVMYSAQEFRAHYGAGMGQAVAGFYSDDAIRMNDSVDITPRVRSVLVHEYVHAVMDELLGFDRRDTTVWIHEGTAEWIEWQYEGGNGPPHHYKGRLKAEAKAGTLPSLRKLNTTLVNMNNPGLMYALSAMAVKELESKGGMHTLLRLLKSCSQGMPFDDALQQHYGMTVEQLDARLRDTLASM